MVRVLVLVCVMASVAGAVAPRWPQKRTTEVYLDTSRWPIVEAEITGTPVVPDAHDVRLVLPNDPSRAVIATRVRQDEPKSYAIMFLVQGTPDFLHSDDDGPNEHRFDMLSVFERALDQAELLHKLPAGSEFSVVTFATGASVRAPWTPTASLSGAVFGTEAEYAGREGRDLVAGIELALSELEKSHADSKLLIVLSEGFDSSSTKPQWAALKRRMMKDFVHAFAFGHRASGNDSNIALLTPQLVDVVPEDSRMTADLNRVIQESRFRFWATFDVDSLGIDRKKPFELAAEVPGARTEALLIDSSVAPPTPAKPRDAAGDDDEDTPLWPLLVGGALLLALVGYFGRSNR